MHKSYNIFSDTETTFNKNNHIITDITNTIRIHAQVPAYYKIYILIFINLTQY